MVTSACSRLSDSGEERKMLERAKKTQVGWGDGGAGAGERKEEGEPVRLFY